MEEENLGITVRDRSNRVKTSSKKLSICSGSIIAFLLRSKRNTSKFHNRKGVVVQLMYSVSYLGLTGTGGLGRTTVAYGSESWTLVLG
jgi:hypothetical protein